MRVSMRCEPHFELLGRCLRAVLLLPALAACAAQPSPEPTPEALGLCEDPRPQVCTMIYAPVCALHRDGHVETHSSSCNACADDTVSRYVEGSCEDGAAP